MGRSAPEHFAKVALTPLSSKWRDLLRKRWLKLGSGSRSHDVATATNLSRGLVVRHPSLCRILSSCHFASRARTLGRCVLSFRDGSQFCSMCHLPVRSPADIKFVGATIVAEASAK